jgi:1-acyl-sn-glycerol-3-phosphate acyltransferase
MLESAHGLLRTLLIHAGRMLSRILFEVRIEGREHLPPDGSGPLIVIANHFSWFDAPILSLHLPFSPAFLVATESRRHWWVRLFIDVFGGIPVWRGQVDRTALRLSLATLAQGKAVGVFPEGGMNPEIAARVARGERILELHGHTSRRSATLARGKPGTALLAVQSHARLLPVALNGTERILDNLPRLRRTPITLRIGPVFGPLQLDPALRGPARRQRLDELADRIMLQIAVLFPPEQRGPYREHAGAG